MATTITKTQLKQIIREEVAKTLKESTFSLAKAIFGYAGMSIKEYGFIKQALASLLNGEDLPSGDQRLIDLLVGGRYIKEIEGDNDGFYYLITSKGKELAAKLKIR